MAQAFRSRGHTLGQAGENKTGKRRKLAAKNAAWNPTRRFDFRNIGAYA